MKIMSSVTYNSKLNQQNNKPAFGCKNCVALVKLFEDAGKCVDRERNLNDFFVQKFNVYIPVKINYSGVGLVRNPVKQGTLIHETQAAEYLTKMQDSIKGDGKLFKAAVDEYNSTY